MEERELLGVLEKYNQNHLIEHLLKLSESEKSIFIRNLKNVDFRLLNSLYSEFKLGKKIELSLSEIEPPDIIPYPRTEEEKRRENEAKIVGESLLKERKVACLLVAGGQATRLGSPYPKGLFPITPVKGKTFFQLFSEKILALSRKYSTEIPLLIMTNPETKEQIEEFFERHHFFGMRRENVIIFDQEVLPVLDMDGKLIIKNRTEIFLSPNGHGNSIKRIYDLGILEALFERGYRYLFYFQVDNPLVRIADPAFLGYHILSGADVSLKIVRKEREDEKIGLYLKISGRPAIVEYSDLSMDIASIRDRDGNLLFWAGNAAMHVFSIDFIKRLNLQGFTLPYHSAIKNAYLGKDGEELKVIKFETFVFDSLRWTERVCAVEILREEEFSPVKNREGPSSPDTARRDMSNLFRKWLALCGIDLPKDIRCEISPFFALDATECREKIKGRRIEIGDEIYLE